MNKETFIQELIRIQDFSGSESEIEALTSLVVEFANSIGFELPKGQLFLGTNSKTGANIVNLSFTTAINCPECIQGHCKAQKPIRDRDGLKTGNKQVCYACSINNRYIETTIKNVWNYILYNTLTVKEIKEQLEYHILLNNCSFLRFNEYGSFINESNIKKAIKISNSLIKNGYIKNSFSYTSNKKLFNKYNNVNGFILSYSNGLDIDLNGLSYDIKQTAIITLSSVASFTNDKEKAIKNGRKILLPLLNNPNVVICCGNCSNCPYCKNKNEKRLVIFLRHGNGWNGHIEDYLTESEYLEYLKQLHKDNNSF